jgi:hypothetical protein
MNRCRTLVYTLVLVVIAPAYATAQITPISSPAGFSGRETLLTFEGAFGTQVSTLNGVTFSYGPVNYLRCREDPATRPFGPQEPTICDTSTPFNGQPITMVFASPMSRLGFELRHNLCNAQATVQFYRAQTLIGTGQTPVSQPQQPGNICGPAAWGFAGFESAAPFDRVVLTAPGNGYLRIDNVRFESTAPPTPIITPIASPAGFSGSATLITFEGAQNRTSTLSGVVFSRGVDYVRCGMFSERRPFGPQEPMGCDNDQPFSGVPITMSFPAQINRVAFETAFNVCGSTATVQLFLGDALVGTVQTPPVPPRPSDGGCSPAGWVFVGFQSTAPFNRVVLTGPPNGYVRIDNLRFENVP